MIRVTLADQTWTFDDRHMTNVEAIALKKTTGLNVRALIGGVAEEDAEAYTALVWLCRRRDGEPDLRYSTLTFDLADFDWEPVDDEGRVLRFNRDGSVLSRDGVPEPAVEDGAADPTPPPSDGSAES